ncbi:MAG: DMT family transporter [Cohaesibacteraceae bacterium]
MADHTDGTPSSPRTQGPSQASHPSALQVLAPTGTAVSTRRAMGSVVIAIAILTLMDAGIKQLTATFGTPQILVMRYGAGFLVASLVLAVLLWLGRVGFPSVGAVKRSFQRSFLVVTVAMCFFYSLSVVPLADATAIAFTAPLYLALLGWLVLKEPVSPRSWLAVVIGLIGVFIIASDAWASTGAFTGALSGYIAASVASLAYAGVLIMTRLHAASDPVPTMITLQSAFSGLLALPFLGLTVAGFAIDGRPFVLPDVDTLWLVLGIGVLGTIGHLFMAWGFKHAEAAKLGPMEYTSLLWAAFYGFLLFGEVPGWRLLIGCVFIIAGTWIVMRGEREA